MCVRPWLPQPPYRSLGFVQTILSSQVLNNHYYPVDYIVYSWPVFVGCILLLLLLFFSTHTVFFFCCSRSFGRSVGLFVSYHFDFMKRIFSDFILYIMYLMYVFITRTTNFHIKFALWEMLSGAVFFSFIPSSAPNARHITCALGSVRCTYV